MLDLRSIQLAIGDARHLAVPLVLERFELGGERYEPVPEQVTGQLTLTRLNSGTLFDLTFSTSIFGPCQRCLEEARLELDIEAREYQALKPEPGAELDTTTPYLDGELLDSDRWARDALVLALPLKVLCRDDCAGLCPSCGIDRNHDTCTCGAPEPDDRWAKLRDLL
jgi:uncharacterized protein